MIASMISRQLCSRMSLVTAVDGLRAKLLLAFVTLFVTAQTDAAEQVSTQAIKVDPMSADPMSGSYLLQLVSGLVVVIICIVVLAWLAKKMNRLQACTDESLKIVGAISMGARERVVLLQVGEQQLLLGVSPGRINALHVLDEPVEASANCSPDTAGKGFAEKLKTMMADANRGQLSAGTKNTNGGQAG